MEAAKKRKVFGIVMRIIFFLVLFCAFFGLYHSPFSYFNDSYGLLKGSKEQIIVRNLMGVWDFVYIKSINCMYLFLGEKPGVMIGYHIFLRMINCLLLFFSIEKVKKPVLSGVFTLVYGMYPFVIYELYNYDGILIAEFFCLLLLFLVSSIIKAVINAIVAKRKQKNIISCGEVSPQWEAENQVPRQELLKQEEMTEEELSEAKKSEEGFSKESGKSLQVEKIGEQMKQNETISGSMEKEEVIKERDGIPNFLELTDEEIRRNAMIAAGLLSGQEETKLELDNNGAAKKTLKKKSLFCKSGDKQQPTAAEPMKETEAFKGTEGAKQQDVKLEQSEKQTNMKLEQPNMEKERPNVTHTQFIENPLPVPKRHVKKEMDYEYQVPKEQMHYDIEEPDKNYFDVE
ncbi:MAG: hypothetical protein HDR01_02720 [Lachnospiraceae bacterium]|nr:hypothetical protein [Lachnospiraceae bacterium]